jgi:hypothetical protein
MFNHHLLLPTQFSAASLSRLDLGILADTLPETELYKVQHTTLSQFDVVRG